MQILSLRVIKGKNMCINSQSSRGIFFSLSHTFVFEFFVTPFVLIKEHFLQHILLEWTFLLPQSMLNIFDSLW